MILSKNLAYGEKLSIGNANLLSVLLFCYTNHI